MGESRLQGEAGRAGPELGAGGGPYGEEAAGPTAGLSLGCEEGARHFYLFPFAALINTTHF